MIDAVLHYGSQSATIVVAVYLTVFEYRVHNIGNRLGRIAERVGKIEHILMDPADQAGQRQQ
jgi:hypothetical protein